MATIQKLIAENLRRIRKEYGYSNADDFAAFLNVPPRTYRRLEGGKTFPQEKTIGQIVAKLGIDSGDLVRAPDAPAPAAKPAISRPLLERLVRLLGVPSLSSTQESHLADALDEILAAARGPVGPAAPSKAARE